MSSWREQLAFAPLENAVRGEETGRRLRQAIELGLLEDGTQLPSENELAAMMGISTQTLRTALAELRHLGLVETRRGRGGGSFVKANTGDIARARRETLAQYSLEDLRDIREYRAVLAGSAAAAAAGRSQQISVSRLASLAAMVGQAEEPVDRARADSKFHTELSAASRSVRLTRQDMALQAEVGPLIWTSPAGDPRQAAQEHAAIVDAIRAGDTTAARARAEEHIRREMNGLIDLRVSMDTAAPGAPPKGSGEQAAITAIAALAQRTHQTAAASIRTLEDAVHAALDTAPPPPTPEALHSVYDTAHTTLAQAAPVLYGLGFITDATYFGHAEIIWSYLPPGRTQPQRLDMDLEFYDFASTPWWPREGTEHTIQSSYAYVDPNGSNAYIISFSKRTTRDGTMTGAATADILVSHLQTDFAPLLDALPPGSCILDQLGVVIATNAGSLLGEDLTPTPEPGRTIDLPTVPWRLHIAPPTN